MAAATLRGGDPAMMDTGDEEGVGANRVHPRTDQLGSRPLVAGAYKSLVCLLLLHIRALAKGRFEFKVKGISSGSISDQSLAVLSSGGEWRAPECSRVSELHSCHMTNHSHHKQQVTNQTHCTKQTAPYMPIVECILA